MTPERIAELRKEYGSLEGRIGKTVSDLREILDALEAAQAEIAHVRGIMKAGEKECRHREEQDRVYRTKITILENQIAVDAGRLRDAAMRVWGEDAHGCDTPDRLADAILGLRAQIADLKRGGVVVPEPAEFRRELPLFVPLAKRWYLAFKAGTKRTEYRPAGILISKDGKERRSPWNADTCRVGRPAVIANGYQVSGRLEMVIESFAEQPDAGDTTAAFDEIYPGHRARGGRVAAITFREPAT